MATSLGTSYLSLRALVGNVLGHFCLLFLFSTAKRASNNLEGTNASMSVCSFGFEISDATVQFAFNQPFLTTKL